MYGSNKLPNYHDSSREINKGVPVGKVKDLQQQRSWRWVAFIPVPEYRQ
jgi:hypothetical protein